MKAVRMRYNCLKRFAIAQPLWKSSFTTRVFRTVYFSSLSEHISRPSNFWCSTVKL